MKFPVKRLRSFYGWLKNSMADKSMMTENLRRLYYSLGRKRSSKELFMFPSSFINVYHIKWSLILLRALFLVDVFW